MNFFKNLNGIKVKSLKNTEGQAVIPITLPPAVAIPMTQSAGSPCSPLVAVGDQVKLGQLIGSSDDPMSSPIHSSVSGVVTSIETRLSQLGFEDVHVVIRPDGRQEWAEEIAPPLVDSKESFLEAVRNSGLVERMGGLVPTAWKLKPQDGTETDTIIVEASEDEPYATTVHMAMLSNTADIIEGCRSLIRWLDVPKCIIAVGAGMEDAKEALAKECAGDEGIQIFALGELYPKAEDEVLCHEVTGRMPKHGKGTAGAGVLVINLISVLKLQQYLRTGLPLVTRSITVDGDAIARPMNIEAPIGTSFADIIDFCGGDKDGQRLRKLIIDGPIRGRSLPTDDLSVIKTNDALICYDEKYGKTDPQTACICCGRCIDACPMGLRPVLIARELKAQRVERLAGLGIQNCLECGACSYICPARRPLAMELKMAKALDASYRKGGRI